MSPSQMLPSARLMLMPMMLLGVVPALSACASTQALISGITAPPVRADENLPQAASLDQDHTRKLYLIVVDRLRKQGSARAALSYLDEYEKQYPGDAQARLMRADCLVTLDAPGMAEPIYKSLTRSEYRSAAYAGLGKVAVANTQWADAVARFQTAVDLNPSNADYINNLAYAQMRAGQYETALATLSQAQQLDPHNVTVRNNMILCLHLAGRDPEAQAMLQGIGNDAERTQVSAMLLNFGQSSTDAQPAHS